MAQETSQPLGVVDSLSVGFRVAQRHLWLVLLPVIADLWLWLGPHLSVAELTSRWVSALPTAGLPADVAQMTEVSRQLLLEAGRQFNLLWLMSNGLTWFSLLMPGLLASPSASSATQVSAGWLLMVVPLLLAGGLGMGSFFLTGIVSRLEEGPEATGFSVRRALRLWLMVMAYGLLLALLALAFLFAASLFLSLAALALPALATFLVSLGALVAGWATLWAYFMLYFVVAAMAWDGVSPSQAVWRSVNVVGRNFWGTLGLVLLTALIMAGFRLIWQRLAPLGPAAVVLSIVGNAFLLTGLAAARLAFYRDRYLRWQQALVK
ncbi:MAG: hypothetical protein RMN53_14220 [Anaerolineae bacterium]|nr:hypothetical protein [Anaerolineae bacterium]